MGGDSLNSLQMETALRENTVTRGAFGGVYPLDALRDIQARPTLIIVNTDPRDKPGKHWLLFYMSSDGVVEMFDSLGKDIAAYPADLERFVERFGTSVRTLLHRVQPANSSLCGQYCLHYAYRRCGGSSMDMIVREMPSAQWIRRCIPILFSIVELLSECQGCEKL